MKQNGVMKKEIEDMLKAVITKPAYSTLGFPAVTAQMKHGRLRFCIDHQALNKRMNGYNFPIPRAEEVLNGMTGETIFWKLDLCSGYWQIRLVVHVQDTLQLLHVGAGRVTFCHAVWTE